MKTLSIAAPAFTDVKAADWKQVVNDEYKKKSVDVHPDKIKQTTRVMCDLRGT